MKKDVVKLIVKVLLYVITAIAGYLGVSSFVGCTVHRTMSTSGHGVGIFHYADTFKVTHGNDVNIKVD